MNPTKSKKNSNRWSQALFLTVSSVNIYFLWQRDSMSHGAIIGLISLGVIIWILSPKFKTETSDTSIATMLTSRDHFKLATWGTIQFPDIQKIELFNPPSRTRMLSITTLDGNRIDYYKNLDSLMDELSSHIPFDRTPKSDYPYAQHDIGQRPLYVILFALVLFLLIHVPFLYFDIPLFHLVSHFSYGFYLFIPICIYLLYPWIKREQKGVPIFAAGLAGLILGFVIAMALSAAMYALLG